MFWILYVGTAKTGFADEILGSQSKVIPRYTAAVCSVQSVAMYQG